MPRQVQSRFGGLPMSERQEIAAPEHGTMQVKQPRDEDTDKFLAHTMAMPESQAARTIQEWQAGTFSEGDINLSATISELKKQSKVLKAGSMARAENMLLAQAHTLDELFNNLARKAHRCEYLNQFEAHLKLAFKAQNQCRMTLETLSNIKNPPVVYAKQANIAHGPQQVNNGAMDTRATKNQNQQNQLLTVNHGETLDGGRACETIGSDPAMATLY